ncbi:MAG TPA: NrfD/PsrC family molybdoenzyme membrane anchor subunit [Streptosporangiaceae bacterium]|jgi:DMSO reductase anchor subunit|nr:NrfD/PsrC family molybdoenzyme membrane anchor subunit [Streptosporangiaceae bacterium]
MSVGQASANGGRGGRGQRGGEQFMVPRAEFRSYYGRPVIKEPVWKEPDVPAYLFFGGLAGASSVLAAAAQLTGRRGLARVAKTAALGGISLSTVALINDLGRPARFYNMLRVVKVSSPMSVGSWILSAYGPAAGVAAMSDLTGILPAAGTAATAGAAVLGPAVTTYTAVLLCDTAVPAWHDAHREMPYLFAGSAASAAGGLGLLAAPSREAEPARRLAIVGAAVELTAKKLLERRLGEQAEPYHSGRAGTLLRAAEILTVCGLAGAALSRRSRVLSAMSGATLLAASAATRFGIFKAGRDSARRPEYTIVPQRERRDARAAGHMAR